ncbi:hypothetical protein BH11PSE12_BH11PSE12_12270 [soil metagenome]
MKLRVVRSLLAGMLIAAAGTVFAAAGAANTIDVTQVTRLQNAGTLLLDVREVDEYAQAHVAGSTLIPLGQLQQRLQEINADKSQPVLVICRSGQRSARAIHLLEQAGFSATVNVEGGMNAWQKAGLPVVSGSAVH